MAVEEDGEEPRPEVRLVLEAREPVEGPEERLLVEIVPVLDRARETARGSHGLLVERLEQRDEASPSRFCGTGHGPLVRFELPFHVRRRLRGAIRRRKISGPLPGIWRARGGVLGFLPAPPRRDLGADQGRLPLMRIDHVVYVAEQAVRQWERNHPPRE